MDSRQLKNLVIIPAITALGMYSPNAVDLLLGTASQESAMGHYISQVNGPAVGIYQMEPRTYYDIWEHMIESNVALKSKIRFYLGITGRPPASRLITDLSLSTIMTRIFYYAIPKPLPDDLPGMAAFWKRWYNTPLGSGTEAKFIENYHRYIQKGTS